VFGGFVVLALLSAGAGPALAQDEVVDEDPQASVLLLMDASGSMAGPAGAGATKIDAAKQAIRDLIDVLPADARIGLRVFGGRFPNDDKRRGCTDTRLIFPVAEVDPEQMKARVDEYAPRGFTPIALSLRRAARDLPAEGRRTIVLVSDGQDTCQPPPPCRVAAQVAREGVDLKIEAIGFRVNPRTRRQLRCIARVGRGSYHDVEDAGELNEQLRAISTRAVRTYEPEGEPLECGTSPRAATEVDPDQFVAAIGVDDECWLKVRLERGQTLTAAATLVSPVREIGTIGGLFQLQILNPNLEEQINPGLVSGANLFSSGGVGKVESLGVYGLAAGYRGDRSVQDARVEEWGQDGFYHLGVIIEDSGSGQLGEQTGGRPFALELLVDVLGTPAAGARPAGERPDRDVEADEQDGAGAGAGTVAGIVAGAALLGVGLGAAFAGVRRRPA
jgi:von Willebrand factor type A domain